MTILQNAFTENLTKDEFIAVNQAGTPVGRASSREALERAHADLAVTILSASEAANEPTLAEAATAKLDGPFAAIVAQGQPPVDNDHVASGATPFTDEEIKLNAEPPKADPFDHDGKDGPGGSLPGKESTAAKGAAKKAAAKK